MIVKVLNSPGTVSSFHLSKLHFVYLCDWYPITGAGTGDTGARLMIHDMTWPYFCVATCAGRGPWVWSTPWAPCDSTRLLGPGPWSTGGRAASSLHLATLSAFTFLNNAQRGHTMSTLWEMPEQMNILLPLNSISWNSWKNNAAETTGNWNQPLDVLGINQWNRNF